MWSTVPDGTTVTRWEVRTYWPLFAKAEKGKKVKFSIRHNDQCLFVFEFRNSAQESIEELLRQSKSVFCCKISERYSYAPCSNSSFDGNVYRWTVRMRQRQARRNADCPEHTQRKVRMDGDRAASWRRSTGSGAVLSALSNLNRAVVRSHRLSRGCALWQSNRRC